MVTSSTSLGTCEHHLIAGYPCYTGVLQEISKRNTHDQWFGCGDVNAGYNHTHIYVRAISGSTNELRTLR
jgi:hypothetical protein